MFYTFTLLRFTHRHCAAPCSPARLLTAESSGRREYSSLKQCAMDYLILINDAPYASERPYNALRLASSLDSDGKDAVRLFFLGDGAWCAVCGQDVPAGMHDIESMMRRFLAGQRRAGVCGTCMDARGIKSGMLIEGAYRSSLDELTAWTAEAVKVLVF